MESHTLSISQNLPFDVEYSSLFKIYDQSNEVLPLWSSRSLQLRNEQSYLKFEIVDKSSDSDLDSVTDISYREICRNVQKSLCHLCNVQVPEGYMTIHQNSEKHKTFVKISEIALERVRKQMGVSYIPGEVLPLIYFCESCVKLIPDKEKRQHLNSKHHKNSIFIDKLYNDFSKLYSDEIDTDTDDDGIISPNSSMVTIDGASEIDKNLTDKGLTVQEKIKGDPVEVENKPKKGVYVEKQNDNVKKKRLVSKKMKVTFDERLKVFIDKLSMDELRYKIDYLDGDHVTIITEDGIRVKLKHENFHGFFVLGKNHVQCKLCCTIARDVKEHMFAKEHLNMLKLPADKNCIRKLEDSKGHCMLCNELVENPEIHALCDKNHDNLMMQAMLFDDDDDFKSKIDETEQNDVPTKVESIDAINVVDRIENNKTNEDVIVKKGGADSIYYFCKVCYVTVSKNDIDFHCKNTKHQSNTKLEYHYLLDYSYALRKVKCIVCKTYFSVDAIKEHLSTTHHSTTYEALLIANYLKKTSRNVFCQLCIVYMRIGNELVHIESPGHIALADAKAKSIVVTQDDAGNISKNVKKFKKTKDNSNVKEKITQKENKNLSSVTENNDSSMDTADKQTVCKVCDVTIMDNPLDVKQHLLLYHQIEDAKEVIENSKMELVGNVLICETCCEYVAIEDKLKHLATPTHIVKSMNNVTIDKTKDNDKTNDAVSDAKNDATNNDDKNNNELPTTSEVKSTRDHFTMDKNGQLFCMICSTNVPKGLNSMIVHEDGKRHKSNFNILITKNNMKDKNDCLECKTCCVSLERHQLMSHLNSCDHLKGGQKTTITYCGVCKKYMTGDMATHVLSVAHKSKEMKRNVASFLCHVCDVLLTNSASNIKEHKKGLQHTNNVRVLEANRIIVNGDKCYCETCDMEFTFKLTRQHITTSQHLVLMGNDVPQ